MKQAQPVNGHGRGSDGRRDTGPTNQSQGSKLGVFLFERVNIEYVRIPKK